MEQRRLVTRTLILTLLFGAIGYTFYHAFFNESNVLSVGDKAPNFILTDLTGERIELDNLRGQGVFLNFWATYCPPCEKEMPYMESQYQIYKDQGVEILAVNVDEPELSVKRFVDRVGGLSFPVVIDRGSKVIDAYNVSPLPTTFLINKDGFVTEVITGGMTEKNIADYLDSIKPNTKQ
ncbi:thiol-disulfide oxidoreductase ResA [Halalkalibacter urbisdiaboli]|uniref:thiol-disulfide oxidoreductase ResA n=1 Tax=Halalkalibacter urbisdiaboli TaxID=1960589 RepID=UPI000B454715|nr:thiol-disulfide oxidoreductase ResA [Halalkalibacter urbisdiaboli]